MRKQYQQNKQKRKRQALSLETILGWIQSILAFARRENLPRLFMVVIVIILSSSILLFWVEPDVSFVDSLWWSLVTMTTVGYGDITPVTFFGRVIAAIDMLVGVGVLAVLTAKIASTLVEQRNRESLGMKAYNHQNHIIICEWNYRTHNILRELRHEPKTQQLPVVLIADIDRKPIDDDYLYFVRGQVSDETLMQANLAEATTVIILGDEALDYANRDAKVVLATLTVESINPEVYTVVELVNEAYVQTCKRANADEIIVGSELSSRLILNAALNHSISLIITELLCYEYGNQLDKIPVPETEIGQPFLDVLLHMKQKYQSIVVGIQQGETGEAIANPDANYRLQSDDFLILIRAARGRNSKSLSPSSY
ncbi:MAG: TrkA family potassium uptake protein [Spirulina sp.]